MSKFYIYSKPDCTYCEQAKNLLTAKGLEYEERVLDLGQKRIKGKTYVSLDDLKRLVPNVKTVPQIFNAEMQLIGGFTELKQEMHKWFD